LQDALAFPRHLATLPEYKGKITGRDNTPLDEKPNYRLETFNSYNGEDALDHTVQYTAFEIDGDVYLLLQLHLGGDARVNYTAPHVFRELDQYSLHFCADGNIACENEVKHPTHNWYTDDTCNWYQDGSTAGKQLDSFPLVDVDDLEFYLDDIPIGGLSEYVTERAAQVIRNGADAIQEYQTFHDQVSLANFPEQRDRTEEDYRTILDIMIHREMQKQIKVSADQTLTLPSIPEQQDEDEHLKSLLNRLYSYRSSIEKKANYRHTREKYTKRVDPYMSEYKPGTFWHYIATLKAQYYSVKTHDLCWRLGNLNTITQQLQTTLDNNTTRKESKLFILTQDNKGFCPYCHGILEAR